MGKLIISNHLRIVISAIALLFGTKACPQAFMSGINLNEVPSPTAADLGKYGNIPVSYYTGRANVTIPIYTMSVRGLEFPITLSYDASGVLVNSIPGWTGHNWTLSAGGVISRSKFGNDDEYVVSGWYEENYFKYYNIPPKFLSNKNLLINHSVYCAGDCQPDVFSFNILGRTGSFFLGNDGEWKVSCDENIEVLFDIEDENNYAYPFIEDFPGGGKQPKTIKQFALRDGDGYVYTFGGTTDAIEYSTDFFYQQSSQQIEYLHATSWYLTSIKDRMGNLLYSLTYKRGKFIAQLFHEGSAYSRSYSTSGGGGLNGSYQETGSNKSFPYSGTLNAPVYLNTISCANGISVNFSSIPSTIATENMYPNIDVFRHYAEVFKGKGNYSNYKGENYYFYYLQTNNESITPYQYMPTKSNKLGNALTSARPCYLSSLTIKDGDKSDSEKLYVQFLYDTSNRLFLKDVIVRNWSNNMKEIAEYKMEYMDIDKLPTDYLSYAVDHWGFFNNKPYNLSMSATNLYKRRNSNTATVQYGMLRKITYPTGGCSLLEYEPNRFSQYITTDRQSVRDSSGIAGGVRIKKITDYSDTDCKEIASERTFSYINPQTKKQSGQLFALPKYYWQWHPAPKEDGAQLYEEVLNVNSLVPLSNSFGPHIGYSYVKETVKNVKQVEYEYSNISAALDAKPLKINPSDEPTPNDIYSERGYKRGKLLSVRESDLQGNTLHTTKYTYRNDDVEADCVYASNSRAYNGSKGNNYLGYSDSYTHYVGGVYRRFYPKYDVVSVEETTYLGGKSILDKTTYNKSDHIITTTNPQTGTSHNTKIRIIDSESSYRNSDNEYTSYTYAFNTSGLNYPSLASNMYLKPVVSTCKRGGKNLFTDKTIFRKLYNGKIVEDLVTRKWDNQTCDTLIKYNDYTATGRLLSYTELGKPTVKLIWGNNDNLLLGKAMGKIETPFIYPTSIFDQTALLNSFEKFRKNNPHLHVTSYTHKLLDGVTSITSPNGNTTYYDYAFNHKLGAVRKSSGNIVQEIEYHLSK